MIKHFYAVRKGRKSGVVVKSWDECKSLVDGYKGAIYKGFSVWQQEEAEKFAQSGDYGKYTPKVKKEKKPNQHKPNKYPCIEKADYRDTRTGIFYKNRCIRRQGPRVVGKNYKPHIGNSLPWSE